MYWLKTIAIYFLSLFLWIMNSDRAEEGMAGLCSMMSRVSAGKVGVWGLESLDKLLYPYFCLDLAWKERTQTPTLFGGLSISHMERTCNSCGWGGGISSLGEATMTRTSTDTKMKDIKIKMKMNIPNKHVFKYLK